MEKHQFLPLEWDGWDGDLDSMVLYDVKWLKDFGPFKKGEKLTGITLNLEEAKIQLHDDNGKVLRECFFHAEPGKQDES